ncbi:hypothetical protein ACHAQF_007323 [Verticillium nonalfalfae]
MGFYGVYIAILIFYFAFIYLMFPETKRLSAEEASRVFDFDRKGRPRDRTLDVETVAKNDLDNEKLSKITSEAEKKA